MSASDPHERATQLPADPLIAILRDGLTQGGEATTGLSILFDALLELEGLGAILEGRPAAEHLAPLLLGMARRLTAALKVLRAEQGGGAP
jgi:hypothetical protein